MLIWNNRSLGRSPFMQAYEQLLFEYAPDYGLTTSKNVATDEVLDSFFNYGVVTFEYETRLYYGQV